jgi:hypothetical protein
VLRDGASAGRRARSAAASPAGPAPGSATPGRARLTEADILHHRDVRIDAHQDVRTGGGIEGFENLKRELHLGKITSILLFFSVAFRKNMALFLLYILIDLRIHQVQNLSCIYGLLLFLY